MPNNKKQVCKGFVYSQEKSTYNKEDMVQHQVTAMEEETN